MNPVLVSYGGYLLAAVLAGFLLGLSTAYLFWRTERKDLLNRCLYGRDYLYQKSEDGAPPPASPLDEIKSAVATRLKRFTRNEDQMLVDRIRKQQEDMRRAGRTDLIT